MTIAGNRQFIRIQNINQNRTKEVILGYLEEMLLREGVLYNSSKGKQFRIEGSLLSNTLAVFDSDGRLTHRIERATLSDDVIVRNVSTNEIVKRLPISIF